MLGYESMNGIGLIILLVLIYGFVGGLNALFNKDSENKNLLSWYLTHF